MEKSKDKNLLKNSGITLIALVITVIVLLILAGVTVATLTGDNGLLTKAGDAKIESEKATIRETIELECISLEGDKNLKGKTDRERLEILVDKLKTRNGLEGQNTNYEVSSRFVTITTKQGFIYTVLFDNTVIEGKLAYLDISDGTIELKENSYKQGEKEYNYQGKYIITGTSTENTVKVIGTGTYDITIKDLKIDVVDKALCAFDANNGGLGNYKRTATNVNLTLEGDNKLYSGYGAGLMFKAFRAKTDNLIEALKSKLIIDGEGSLDAECLAGYDGAGIGGLYDAGSPVTYIEIKSGNIKAIGKGSGNGIGGGLRQPVGNIIINNGTIYAKRGNGYGYGIGSYDATTEYIKINGGNIYTTRMSKIPTDGENDLYKTQIKLKDAGESKKVTKLITSDNIEYGIKDMYTFEEGMLYLYLPEGSRTITVEADGKTYSGVVNTTVEGSITELTAI